MQKKDLQRAEFWIATILYVFAIVTLISNVTSRSAGYVKYDFKEYGLTFSYFSNYFVPEVFRYSILYFSFLLLNFCVIPALINKKNELLNYSLIFVLILLVGLILGVCKTYSEAYEL